MTILTKNILFDHVNTKLYDTDGFIDSEKIREFLKVKKVFLINAIGMSPRTLEQNPHSDSVQKNLKKMVYIFALLDEMLESEREILIWLKAPQLRFDGKAPLDIIYEGKMDMIIEYLHDIKYDYVPDLSLDEAAQRTKNFIKNLPDDLIDADLGPGI
jgi:uncharacterized protein (DUF2384 family)